MSKFTAADDNVDDEEWRRTNADKPTEVQAPRDDRSLYVKLQEQKAIKEEAFNEANRFSNLIKRLDDDEVDFLANIREAKDAEDEARRREKESALLRFRVAQDKFDARQVQTGRVEKNERIKRIGLKGIKLQTKRPHKTNNAPHIESTVSDKGMRKLPGSLISYDSSSGDET